jgi:hypothetical protein
MQSSVRGVRAKFAARMRSIVRIEAVEAGTLSIISAQREWLIE